MDGPQIHVRSAAAAFPGRPVDNAALARRFGAGGVWEQWVDTFIGTRSRHLVTDPDTGKAEVTLTDLGAEAGGKALAAAGVEPADVDLLVLATATPDQLMPATAALIADRLGIDGIPVYQLQSGCTGAVQALDLTRRLLSTGAHRTALVLGGDVCAKHLDFSVDFAKLPPSQQVNFVLFGDGAGAAVLTTEPGPVVLRDAFVRLVGKGREPGQVVEWFGLTDRDSDRPAVSEDYKAIEEHVPVMAAEIATELLERLGWDETELDFLLPPQLSGRMTGAIVDALGLVARPVSTVAETGNVGNAMPFVQIAEVLPLLTPGDRTLGIAVESSKWIKSGFALERL